VLIFRPMVFAEYESALLVALHNAERPSRQLD
jgi:hypothetical protein